MVGVFVFEGADVGGPVTWRGAANVVDAGALLVEMGEASLDCGGIDVVVDGEIFVAVDAERVGELGVGVGCIAGGVVGFGVGWGLGDEVDAVVDTAA